MAVYANLLSVCNFSKVQWSPWGWHFKCRDMYQHVICYYCVWYNCAIVGKIVNKKYFTLFSLIDLPVELKYLQGPHRTLSRQVFCKKGPFLSLPSCVESNRNSFWKWVNKNTFSFIWFLNEIWNANVCFLVTRRLLSRYFLIHIYTHPFHTGLYIWKL